MTSNLSINLPNSVHMFMAHKGGVGKTTLAALLCEWVMKQGVRPVVFDADAKNQESCIGAYTALRARRLAENLIVTGADGLQTISPVGFSSLLESVLMEDGPHVIDTGANSYTQWLNYMQEMSLVDLLEESARTLYLHAIVAGGEMCAETVLGVLELVEKLPTAKVVLWVNQPNALARMAGGIHFLDSEEFKTLKPRLEGVVTMLPMSEVTREAYAVLGPLHILSGAVKADGNLVTLQRAIAYKAWARQAFNGLDAMFIEHAAATT